MIGQTFNDQANMNFVRNSLTHVMPEVYRHKFPSIQYPNLVPVDTSPDAFSEFVTATSMESIGKAELFNMRANAIPAIGMDFTQSTVGVYGVATAATYTIQEVGQAQKLGISLSSESLIAARRFVEEKIDQSAISGIPEKNETGLINNGSVTQVSAAATGTGGLTTWASKTPALILADINDAITRVHDNTNTVSIADTILLSDARFNYIASTMVPDSGALTIMEFLSRTNVYTMRTGQPLNIRAVRGLATAGAGSTQRMVAYRNDREVLTMYMPVPFQLTPPRPVTDFVTQVVGWSRFTKVHFKLPKEAVYVDGI